eukprot:CAMPEP_0183435946 /NCGR_PEP_ID=MMETSP0370-20130417/68944_1 /TAXON_ID=268820 /ORGANISM="Peridinium aciculiferum, Strain PAER-2" /LENGTH=247 /DNA_ID=CAMNT_0025623239 /DNA_START=59 /DNA_END=802 /DNA_ORIENTATION=+
MGCRAGKMTVGQPDALQADGAVSCASLEGRIQSLLEENAKLQSQIARHESHPSQPPSEPHSCEGEAQAQLAERLGEAQDKAQMPQLLEVEEVQERRPEDLSLVKARAIEQQTEEGLPSECSEGPSVFISPQRSATDADADASPPTAEAAIPVMPPLPVLLGRSPFQEGNSGQKPSILPLSESKFPQMKMAQIMEDGPVTRRLHAAEAFDDEPKNGNEIRNCMGFSAPLVGDFGISGLARCAGMGRNK